MFLKNKLMQRRKTPSLFVPHERQKACGIHYCVGMDLLLQAKELKKEKSRPSLPQKKASLCSKFGFLIQQYKCIQHSAIKNAVIITFFLGIKSF